MCIWGHSFKTGDFEGASHWDKDEGHRMSPGDALYVVGQFMPRRNPIGSEYDWPRAYRTLYDLVHGKPEVPPPGHEW